MGKEAYDYLLKSEQFDRLVGSVTKHGYGAAV